MATFALVAMFLLATLPSVHAWELDELSFEEARGPGYQKNHGFDASIDGDKWRIEDKRRQLRRGEKMKLKRTRSERQNKTGILNGGKVKGSTKATEFRMKGKVAKNKRMQWKNKGRGKQNRSNYNGAVETEEPTPVPVEEVLPTVRSEFVITSSRSGATEAPTPIPAEEVLPTLKAEFVISYPKGSKREDNSS